MKLLRLAIIYFNSFPNKWFPQNLEFNGVTIGVIRSWELKTIKDEKAEVKLKTLIKAETDISEQIIQTQENQIHIPEEIRKRAERAIETYANLISIAHGSARSISSPTPCLVLLPENPDETTWLESVQGIIANKNRAIITGGYFIEGKILQALIDDKDDRSDGIALLAEALSHHHATGKFHEFYRLFERAFSSKPSDLIQPLTDYLAGASQGYTELEVRKWVEVRHLATHTDRRPSFALESDTRPCVARMEQAAYDVLLNKKLWRSPSTERRKLWSPSAGTGSNTGNIFSVQGRELEIHFQLLDEFCAYPMDLTGILNGNLSAPLWSKWAE